MPSSTSRRAAPLVRADTIAIYVDERVVAACCCEGVSDYLVVPVFLFRDNMDSAVPVWRALLEERCARGGKRAGGILRFGRGLWANARGAQAVNTCTIYWKMAAQMEEIIV